LWNGAEKSSDFGRGIKTIRGIAESSTPDFMKKWPGVKIRIGEHSEIDEGAILGYPPGRADKRGEVVLGEESKIRSGSVIYQGVTIGHRFETGHNVIIREENEIGDSVCVWTNTVVDYGCRIGNRVKIHSNCYVAQHTVIEDDVFIAPGVIFANDKYPVSSHLEGPQVRRGARIGVNVTILPGVVIGEEALVGAGAVVTKDVPNRGVVVGNPARWVANVDEPQEKEESFLKKGVRKGFRQ
jgi:acetyltransferase-like isoleucine patch superfamily enzyme